MDQKERIIKTKAILGLRMTARERAYYLLYIATPEEVKEFMERERKGE